MSRRSRSSLVALSLAPLAACHDSSDEAQFLAPGSNALGFATESLELSGGVLAAREFESGTDQNGDGDGNDTLLRIVDLASGSTHLVPDVGAHASGGSLVAFTVPEAKANADLNGDGDELDQVLHVYDARRRSVANVGFATDGSAPLVTESFVIAVVWEEEQGQELDGEPGLAGVHPLVYEAESGRVEVLDVLVRYQLDTLRVAAGHLAGLAREDQVVDLNGDGDRNDELAFWHELATGTTSLGHAASVLFALDANFLLYRADEFEESADIDGDGIEFERVCVVVELASGTRHVFDDVRRAAAGGGLAFVQLDEFAGSFVLDAATGRLDEVPDHVLTWTPRFAERRMAYLAELEEDFDGDGDAFDTVLLVYDARTGLTENTRFVVEEPEGVRGFDLDAQRLVYLSSSELHERRHGGGPEDLEISAHDFVLADGRVALLQEQSIEVQRVDSHPLAVLDLATRRLELTGLTVDPFLFEYVEFQPLFDLEGERLVVGVREEFLGADENRDGDFLDTVAYAVRLR